MSEAEHNPPAASELRAHGDGEYEPHRPPKYVEGVYKPGFDDPEADAVLLKASLLPPRHPNGLYWATTDDDGASAGVIRRTGSGRPIGSDLVVARLYDGEIEWLGSDRTDYEERLAEHVPEPPEVDDE